MQKQLDKAFKELNAELIVRQQTWAIERKAAVRAAQQAMGNRGWDYDELFNVAGGKGWYTRMTTLNNDQLSQFCENNVTNMIIKRDATIINGLKVKGVTKIKPFKLVATTDGFEGTFKIGKNTVTIQTILAGGYNVQCLHMRTLVRVV